MNRVNEQHETVNNGKIFLTFNTINDVSGEKWSVEITEI